MLDGLRTTLGLARRGYQRLKDQIAAWQVAENTAPLAAGASPADEAEVSFRQVIDLAQSFLKQDIESTRPRLADEILASSEETERLRTAVNRLEPQNAK